MNRRAGNSMQDGKIGLLQFKVSGTSTQAVLALEIDASHRWGINVLSDNSVVIQWNNGSGFVNTPLLTAGSFKRDVWYVLMLGADNGPDLVRLWERDKSPDSDYVRRYQVDQVSSAQWNLRLCTRQWQRARYPC